MELFRMRRSDSQKLFAHPDGLDLLENTSARLVNILDAARPSGAKALAFVDSRRHG